MIGDKAGVIHVVVAVLFFLCTTFVENDGSLETWMQFSAVLLNERYILGLRNWREGKNE